MGQSTVHLMVILFVALAMFVLHALWIRNFIKFTYSTRESLVTYGQQLIDNKGLPLKTRLTVLWMMDNALNSRLMTKLCLVAPFFVIVCVFKAIFFRARERVDSISTKDEEIFLNVALRFVFSIFSVSPISTALFLSQFVFFAFSEKLLRVGLACMEDFAASSETKRMQSARDCSALA